MTKRAERRAAPSRAHLVAVMGVSAVCGAAACSGGTDVVGVVNDSAVAAAEPTSVDDGSPASDVGAPVAVVIGRPLLGWQGRVYDWPLAEPLREVFAERDGSDGSERAGRRDSWSSEVTDAARSAVLRGAPAERVIDFFADLSLAAVVARDGAGDEYLVALDAGAFESGRCDGFDRSSAVRDGFRAADAWSCGSGWSR